METIDLWYYHSILCISIIILFMEKLLNSLENEKGNVLKSNNTNCFELPRAVTSCSLKIIISNKLYNCLRDFTVY